MGLLGVGARGFDSLVSGKFLTDFYLFTTLFLRIFPRVVGPSLVVKVVNVVVDTAMLTIIKKWKTSHKKPNSCT